MGFVEDPVADFSLFQDRPDGRASQLLRRNQQHRRISEAHLVERFMTLGQRQQAVDRDAGRDALALEPGDLVGHERHEGRDDHGKAPVR